MTAPEPSRPPAPRSGAARVAVGIFLSRVLGFVRDRALAHYFGAGAHADVFRAALRGPNLLQNLLGEGSLSASFVPIYSRFLEQGRREDAARFAGACFGLLLTMAATLCLLGVVLAEPLVAVLSPGFLLNAEDGVDRFSLTVQAIRILFPMTGVLVLSAWALGVLTSHRRFFLPYAAPVLWNLSILTALVGGAAWLGGVGEGLGTRDRLLLLGCAGALVGGLLQFLVQLPAVLWLLEGFHPSLSLKVAGVREALSAFVPVVAGRGIYQLSAYLDLLLAGFLHQGAIAVQGYAAQIYLLPVSLFGLAVASAELPELSRLRGEAAERLRERLERAAGQVRFVVTPTVVGYLAFGFLIVGALYRTGSFGAAETWLVTLALSAYTLGLPATTASRLLQNTFYALGEPRTPAQVAAQRIAVSVAVGVPAMVGLDRLPVALVAGPVPRGGDLFLGAVGLALASAVGAWVEVALLRRALRRLLPGATPRRRRAIRVPALALAAALPAAALWWLLPPLHPALSGAAVVGTYALLYLAAAMVLRWPELEAWVGRFRRGTGERGTGG